MSFAKFSDKLSEFVSLGPLANKKSKGPPPHPLSTNYTMCILSGVALEVAFFTRS
jgi:hypothetical protein